MKVGILESEFLDPGVVQRLSRIGQVSFYENGLLADFLRDKEVAVVRLKHKLDEHCLAAASSLRFILSATTGLNHIDLNYVHGRGIEVVSLKGETQFLKNVRATAEHTLGLAVALLRHYPRVFNETDSSNMDRRRFFGSELYEKNIGMIGLGRIGQLLKTDLQAFGSNLRYYDPNVDDPSIEKKSTLQSLIEASDMIFLLASYSPENDALINQELLAMMKGKYFINTARGELVDEESLITLLEKDHFKGVALDVIRDEQGDNNMQRLMALKVSKPLILSPHIGGATFDSLAKAESFVIEKWLQKAGVRH